MGSRAATEQEWIETFGFYAPSSGSYRIYVPDEDSWTESVKKRIRSGYIPAGLIPLGGGWLGEVDALRKRMLAGDQEAIDLACLSILRMSHDYGVVSSQYLERAVAFRRKGGRKRAAKIAAADSNAWMRPIFDQAYAQLVADGSRQRGHAKLLLLAHRVACHGHPDHGRRDKLKESHARNYLADRRRKKNRDGC